MKKLSVDLMMGRRSRCYFRRNLGKTTIVRMALPASSAVRVPILGQFGIQNDVFVKAFNSVTEIFEIGIPIAVIIAFTTLKTYTITIKGPSVSFLGEKSMVFSSRSWLSYRGRTIRKLLLFNARKIALLKNRHISSRIRGIKKKQHVRTILGAMNSWNLDEQTDTITPSVYGRECGERRPGPRRLRSKKIIARKSTTSLSFVDPSPWPLAASICLTYSFLSLGAYYIILQQLNQYWLFP